MRPRDEMPAECAEHRGRQTEGKESLQGRSAAFKVVVDASLIVPRCF